VNTIAVVGASLAGLAAARALRAEGFDGRLVLIGAEEHLPYDRPPLSKDFLVGKVDETALALHDVSDGLEIDYRLGAPASGLTGRTVHTARGDVPADGVVITTGAVARRLPGQPDGVHVLRTLDDARALRAALHTGVQLVIVGAGFVGAEVASSARALGCDVTVVEAAAVPLERAVGPEMGAALATLLPGNGVRLITGVGVSTVGSTHVDLADGRRLDADVVLVGIGSVPNTRWLAGSAVAVGNGVLCDAGGGTNVPRVVAAGDCAAWYEPVLGTHERLEHWTGAGEQAVIAAATLLHGREPGPRRPAYFWSDQFGVRVQFAGRVAPGDEVTVEAGDPADGSWLAVYRRPGDTTRAVTAVLGVSQGRLFTRRRREIGGTRPQSATQPQLVQGAS
jgi:NADPH-dependent 2,4-dienoyl-CoA reductase/sulfur reductase-like enzyme